MDIATLCRKLADHHGMLDLPERVRDTVDLQRQQRVALAQAAECIERQRDEKTQLLARIAELEAARVDGGESSLKAGHESGQPRATLEST